MTLHNKILSSRYPKRRRFAWWKCCSIKFFLHCMLLQYFFNKQKNQYSVYMLGTRMRGSRKQFGKEVSDWEFCFQRLVGGGGVLRPVSGIQLCNFINLNFPGGGIYSTYLLMDGYDFSNGQKQPTLSNIRFYTYFTFKLKQGYS